MCTSAETKAVVTGLPMIIVGSSEVPSMAVLNGLIHLGCLPHRHLLVLSLVDFHHFLPGWFPVHRDIEYNVLHLFHHSCQCLGQLTPVSFLHHVLQSQLFAASLLYL